MSARRPITFTAEQLLASKPRLPVSRANSLESVHRRFICSRPECREDALNQKVISLEEELRKAKLETEYFRMDNAKLQQQCQTGNSHKNAILQTLSESREKNRSLELEAQQNKRMRAELGQQLLSIRQESSQFRQQITTIDQEKKDQNDRIREENISMGKKLNSLEQEAVTLRSEKARLEREKASLKKEFEEERVSLQKKVEELKWDEEQRELLKQKFDAVQQNANKLAQEAEQLQQRLDRETEKLKETQQREQLSLNQLKMLKDSSHACPKIKCMEMRTERDQLARNFEKKCGRPECVTAKANLEEAKNRIRQMEKKKCNSTLCQSQQLKDMNDTIGLKIHVGAREYSHSEALQQLLQRAEMKPADQSAEVRSLRSHLQKMQQENQHLLTKLDAAAGSNVGSCTRSDCQRIQEQLRRMQSEPFRQGRSAAKDMTILSGGDYDEPLQEFNEVFTDPDELLGVLESYLEPFVAKKVLCKIFQHAYKLCKEAALQMIRKTLQSLFTVSEDRSKKDIMGEISRAYGLLLHVSGLKSDETVCRDISLKIMTTLIEDESYNQAGKALQDKQEYLLKCVEVAWKFVTLPSPIIACQPKMYIPQIVDLEYGYWDESTPDATLIYTRPVVYRCYDGHRAEKGMVANTNVLLKMAGTEKKGLFQKVVGLFQREP